MKRAFAFIGSPHKEKSNTYTLTKMMLDRLVEMDPEVTYEIQTAGHVILKYCNGCSHCMLHGTCPLDQRDYMGALKKKLEEADFLILGSPVYAIHMTGQMKTFFDRLASWYHVMYLAGKPGMTVVTTAHDGAAEVGRFMSYLMAALGIKVLASLDGIGYGPGKLADREESEKRARAAAEIVYPYLSGMKPVESDELLEASFAAMKAKVMHRSAMNAFDYHYWESRGMLDISSFAGLLQHRS